MSTSMMMMWISFVGMGALIIAIGLILLSRYKLKGFFKGITAFIAYLFFIVGSLLIAFVVFSGPTA